jgi:hypothetical protein
LKQDVFQQRGIATPAVFVEVLGSGPGSGQDKEVQQQQGAQQHGKLPGSQLDSYK